MTPSRDAELPPTRAWVAMRNVAAGTLIAASPVAGWTQSINSAKAGLLYDVGMTNAADSEDRCREFREVLLKTVRDLAPGIADEIATVMDDPDAGKQWLRDHGFAVTS